MTTVIEVRNLTKRYRETVAVADVSFSIEENTIYGLLGRNGAGKTTIMSILTAQNFATSGDVRVFGEHPYENARVLSRVCFVRESQRYPDDANARHALRMASLFFPNWDQAFADRLAVEFALPMKRRIKKLSRHGRRSHSSTSRTWGSTPSHGRSSTIDCSRTTPSIRAPSSCRAI